jgi:glutamate/tyrosine decarboxylase-like PLP-dependent enzyme
MTRIDALLHLHALVREHPDFEVLHEPTPYHYSFRFVPNHLADRQHEPQVEALVDRLNHDIAEAIQKSGVAFVVTTRMRGKVALQMSISSHRTEPDDIDATFEAVASIGRTLARERINPSKEEKVSC